MSSFDLIPGILFKLEYKKQTNKKHNYEAKKIWKKKTFFEKLVG